MRETLVILSSILLASSCIPYITDIAKGKTRPNLVTWFTWMIVVGISTAAAISDHAVQTATLSGVITITDVVIIAMSLKRGIKRFTAFDIVCQLLAIIGLVLWRLTGNPSTAVALSLLIIVIAAMPTWRHAWLKPYEETWQGFAMAGAGGLLTLISLTSYTFVALALPVTTVLNNSLMTSIILGRRTAKHKKDLQ